MKKIEITQSRLKLSLNKQTITSLNDTQEYNDEAAQGPKTLGFTAFCLTVTLRPFITRGCDGNRTWYCSGGCA